MQSIANNYTPTLAPKLKRRVIWPYIVLLSWLAIAVLALLNRDTIIDWWKLFGYKAPANILTLASEDTMTPYATTLLKINHPLVLQSTAFNKYCPNDGGEKTIVLGCYHSDEDGIYLLSVSDPRLNGVEEVTAAHEMLHAAYSRLSSSERAKVDGWLLNYYNHDLKDPRIIATIAAYRKTEPGEVVNEMHSVFGTEIMNLPAPLENYYKRYFNNRHKIAQYAAQYEAEFTTRQNAVNSDDTTLSTMLTQINNLKSSISSQYSQITTEQKQLTSLSASGNIDEYNSLVGPYNQMVDGYNAEVDQYKNLISNYNNLIDTRNSVALTENQLYSELSGATASVQSK
jgi:hypothetical protein